DALPIYLRCVSIDPESQGQCRREVEHMLVEERDPDLERMGHRHLVGLHQDAGRKPGVTAHGLHPGHVFESCRSVIHGLDQICGCTKARTARVGCKQSVLGVLAKDLDVAEKPLFQRRGAAKQKAPSASSDWHPQGNAADGSAQWGWQTTD